MAIYQSASGYPGIEATPLARMGYSDRILSRVYENDWLYRVVNSDLMDEITQCMQVIQIMRAPEVGPMRSYQLNQQLVPNTITTTATCLTICNLAYQDIKFDTTTIKQACDRWPAFEQKMLESLYQSYVDSQRKYVVGRMMAQTSPQNMKDAAGKFHDINLGVPGKPVVINPQTITKAFFQLRRALVEQLRWVDNEMFVIVPPILREILAQSNYANAEWSCSCGMIIDGMWDKQIAGFNVIETVHAPVRRDESGALAFFILAGHKMATAYASNIIEARLNTSDPNYFGVRYQYLVAWGAEVIYPEALALAYWTFE